MFELIGVDGLTQWDVGRQVKVDKDVDMVHFSNRPYGYSKNVKVTDGVADVPDMFLTSCAPLRVWAYVGDFEKGYTKIEKIYEVKPKNRPENYIYTPEEVKTWEKLQSEIGDLANLATEAKENLVAAINEVAADMSKDIVLDTTLTQSGQAADAKAVGDALAGKQPKGDYLTQDNLQSATNAALAQAKASGEFDGADGKSAYQYAQDGGYTGTETEFAEKLATDIPSALPNPNALTFTGAVNATYDGSTAISVEIPSGGSGGADISLGLTSAAVGQTIKVKAIDDIGKPTAWEPVDMPTGGNSEEMRVIKTITITAADVNSIYFNRDDNGLPFALTKHIRIRMYSAATNTGSTQAMLFFRAGQTSGDKPQFEYPIKVNSNNTNYIFGFVFDLYSAVNCWYGDFAHARSSSADLYRFVPSEDNNSSDITVREIKLVWSNASVFFPQGATIVVEGM